MTHFEELFEHELFHGTATVAVTHSAMIALLLVPGRQQNAEWDSLLSILQEQMAVLCIRERERERAKC